MKEIIGFIKSYAREVNKPILLFCSLFTAVLIWLNYHDGLEDYLSRKMNLPFPWFTGHFILFLFAFLIPHALLGLTRIKPTANPVGLLVCLFVAPAIFALKVSMDTSLQVTEDSSWNLYWNDILYWPLRLIVMLGLLGVSWRLYHRQGSFYGLTGRHFKVSPYLWMLLIMLPLITAASTQPDFQAAYPKLHNILPLPTGASPGWFYKLLFELSYGSDFFSIEMFFRGFLVIGFMKWIGKDAILPMACFYCTIHFGKPLGECISSYFGGLLLGIVSYHTRSIYGGLMVHLGIAWMMELGGYIGNHFKW